LPVDFVSRVVVLATGGMSLPKTGSDGFGYELAKRLGHSIVPPTPALAPLVLDDDFHAPLSGIAHETELTIRAVAEKPVRISGPMLWTHFGASGPAAMDASRHWHRAVLNGETPRITVNFLPGADFVSAERMLTELAASQAKVLARNALAANLPARLVERLMEAAGVPQGRTMGQLTRDERRRLVHALTEWPMPVRDSRGYNYAEVTAGGLALTEIDPATMESRVCPGLYLAGEILDVDGRLGGFNFQWAWATAHVAARGLAAAFRKQ